MYIIFTFDPCSTHCSTVFAHTEFLSFRFFLSYPYYLLSFYFARFLSLSLSHSLTLAMHALYIYIYIFISISGVAGRYSNINV